MYFSISNVYVWTENMGSTFILPYLYLLYNVHGLKQYNTMSKGIIIKSENLYICCCIIKFSKASAHSCCAKNYFV